jgi:hypothetical protein
MLARQDLEIDPAGPAALHGAPCLIPAFEQRGVDLLYAGLACQQRLLHVGQSLETDLGFHPGKAGILGCLVLFCKLRLHRLGQGAHCA